MYVCVFQAVLSACPRVDDTIPNSGFEVSLNRFAIHTRYSRNESTAACNDYNEILLTPSPLAAECQMNLSLAYKRLRGGGAFFAPLQREERTIHKTTAKGLVPVGVGSGKYGIRSCMQGIQTAWVQRDPRTGSNFRSYHKQTVDTEGKTRCEVEVQGPKSDHAVTTVHP